MHGQQNIKKTVYTILNTYTIQCPRNISLDNFLLSLYILHEFLTFP